MPSVGLIKTSLVDYPGLVAATIFTSGCNLRCPYCHNPELVAGPEPDDFVPLDEVIAFLKRRHSVLGGVCITGGEPFLHDYLGDLVAELREIGYKIKLDTNGTFPDRIPAVKADYIALDLKLAPQRLGEFGFSSRTGSVADPESTIRTAIEAVRSSAARYEFRTTVLPGVVGKDDIRALVALMERGERYVLAAFRPGKTLDPTLAGASAPTADYLEMLCEIAREAGVACQVRDHAGL